MQLYLWHHERQDPESDSEACSAYHAARQAHSPQDRNHDQQSARHETHTRTSHTHTHTHTHNEQGIETHTRPSVPLKQSIRAAPVKRPHEPSSDRVAKTHFAEVAPVMCLSWSSAAPLTRLVEVSMVRLVMALFCHVLLACRAARKDPDIILCPQPG